MLIRYTAIVLLFFILGSCQPVLKAVYGIKKPKYCDDDKILRYSKKLGIEDEIYRFENFTGGKKGSFKFYRIPSLRVYAKNGSQIKFIVSCTNDYNDLITMSYDSINNVLEREEKLKLQDWSNHLYSLTNGKKVDIGGEKPTFVVFFARYIGKLNKINTIIWINNLKKRDDIELLIVDVDITKVD